jgi:hypothetical protein
MRHPIDLEGLVRPTTRYSLGLLIAAQFLFIAPGDLRPTAMTSRGAQGKLTACSIIDAQELKRATGRQDYLKRGPMSDDPATPGENKSACGYLGFVFELTSPAEAGSFEKTRGFLEKSGTKIQPVSGAGDAAFYWWDPRPGTTRPVGIVMRKGTSQLMVLDMTTPDSIAIVKPELLTVAKTLAPKLR